MWFWYCVKAVLKPAWENRPETPFSTSWSCLSSDGTVYKLRAKLGACLLWWCCQSAAPLTCIIASGGRIRSQPKRQPGGRKQQVALLSTAEPSCRVSMGWSEAAVDVAMLIILAGEDIALNPLPNHDAPCSNNAALRKRQPPVRVSPTQLLATAEPHKQQPTMPLPRC